MTLTLREYTHADYPMVQRWWAGHGWHGVPEPVLPRFGMFGVVDGKETAAAWLYMDNSVGVCMLEWVVTDPAAGPRAAMRAIQAVTEFMKGRAIQMDYGVMLTTCRQESLARLHEKAGFHRTDEGMIHLINLLRT